MVDGKLFVGIGLEIEDIGGKTFEDMSDKVKKAMENNAKFDMSNQSASISPSASFGAYFCLGIDEFGTCYMEEGSAIINLGLEAEFETVVEAIVPIVVAVSVSGELESTLTLGFDIDNAAFKVPALDITFTAGLEGRVGVGIPGLSAGFYGSTESVFDFNNRRDINDEFNLPFGLDSLTLSGESGLYGDLCGAIFQAPMFSGELVIYQRRTETEQLIEDNEGRVPVVGAQKLIEALGSPDSYSFGSYDKSLAYQSWNGSRTDATSALCSKTDPYARPKLISDGENLVLLFRGYNKNASLSSNSAALFWSLYDRATQSWSAPVMLDGNNRYDDAFAAAVADGKICVAYVQSSVEFSENPASLADAEKTREIYFTAFDSGKKTFAEPVRLTDNDVLDTLAGISEVNGVPTVTWVSNSENHAFLMSGENTVYTCSLRGGSPEKPTALGTDVGLVISCEPGMLGSRAVTALVTDSDGSILTDGDRKLRLMSSDGEVLSETAGGRIGRAQFTKYNGSNCLVYSRDNALYILDGASSDEKALIPAISSGCDETFSLVTSEGGSCAVVYTDRNTA